MKIAGNQLGHLSDYYHRELDALLGKDETSAIFATVVEHFLGISRSQLLSRLKENINQSDLLDIYDCCKELKKGKPLQYILKEAWFYDLKFFVNDEVLIPRPETEELVDLIMNESRDCKTLLDIGTGSGCIPLAVKKNLPACEVTACDISKGALNVAMLNAEKLGLKTEFVEADVLDDAEFGKRIAKQFEVIVSNPPYIKEDERTLLHENVIAHEPHLALFVTGDDDIIFYRKIVDHCQRLLKTKGKLYFELNPLTAEKVKAYAESKTYFSRVELRKDMSGKTRFLIATRIQ